MDYFGSLDWSGSLDWPGSWGWLGSWVVLAAQERMVRGGGRARSSGVEEMSAAPATMD